MSTACPFCLVMLDDAVNDKVGAKALPEGRTQVVDVSQILARSLLPVVAVNSQPVEPSPATGF